MPSCKGVETMSLTYQEIKEQYAALQETARYMDQRCPDISKILLTTEPKQIVFIGCGSSYSLSISGAAIAQMHGSTPARAIPAGDLLLHAERYAPGLEGALLVILSRSGTTSEAVMAVEALKKQNVRFSLLSVCCAVPSPLAALSDMTIEIPWAFDHSVCQTRTVTCLYYAVARLVAVISGRTDWTTDLEHAVNGGSAYMSRIEDSLRELAALPWQTAVVLGDAEIAGLCEEGALAFKEICRLPSAFHHVLDYRHGPMVLLDSRVLVVIALSSPDNPLEMALAKEIRDKGATVVLYSDTPAPLDGVTNIVFGEKLHHVAKGIPFIAICQLLACLKAEHTGTDPDHPEGLSAWIAL